MRRRKRTEKELPYNRKKFLEKWEVVLDSILIRYLSNSELNDKILREIRKAEDERFIPIAEASLRISMD